VDIEYLEASKKALDGEQFAEFERGVPTFYSQMAVIRIRPRQARYFDFGAGLMPRFLLELASHAAPANESTEGA
jgi:hypothetical protein